MVSVAHTDDQRQQQQPSEGLGFVEREGVLLRAPISRLQEYCRVTREIDEPAEPEAHLRGVLQYFQVGKPCHTNEKGILGWVKYYGAYATKQQMQLRHSALIKTNHQRNSVANPRVCPTGEIDVDEMPLPQRAIYLHRTGAWNLVMHPDAARDMGQKKLDRLVTKYVQRYNMAADAIRQKTTDDMDTRKKTLLNAETVCPTEHTLETYVTNRVKFAVSRARIQESLDVQRRCMSVVAHEMQVMQTLHKHLPGLQRVFQQNFRSTDMAAVASRFDRALYTEWAENKHVTQQQQCLQTAQQQGDTYEADDHDDACSSVQAALDSCKLSGGESATPDDQYLIMTEDELAVLQNYCVPEFDETVDMFV